MDGSSFDGVEEGWSLEGRGTGLDVGEGLTAVDGKIAKEPKSLPVSSGGHLLVSQAETGEERFEE